ncbi:MAG: DUF2357 domain-containing protein [Vicinamibacterales bacterium]
MSAAGSEAIRWRKAGTEFWTPLLAAPAENRHFCETTTYHIVKPGLGWIFRVDDEPLADAPSDPSSWQWTPGFFAGEVTAELVGPQGLGADTFLLDVSPDDSKLGRETFAEMLDELWREDPALVIGSEPATSRIGELGRTQNPWLEFARLRRYAPEFLQAAVAIRAKPRRALEVHRRSAPLHRVRNADRQTVLALARSPAAALVLDDMDPTVNIPADCRFDVPVVEETLDSAANRAMGALVQALLHRARALRQTLEQLVSRTQSSETRTSLDHRWPVRREVLDQLTVQLKRLSRQSPFVDVSRVEVTAAGLIAVAADPVYARAWGRGWRALRHGVDAAERAERLWISPSWEIYERWCFLRVGKMLAAALPEWHWRRIGNERWEGASGGARGELRFQPTFVSRTQASPRMWSVSREREPDMVLTVTDESGTRFVLLDAKYRASRPNVLDAMASAHIYQDSLRIGSQRPEAALLLVPMAGGAPWLEDESFQREHRVGVCALSLGTEATLPALVRRLFGSA